MFKKLIIIGLIIIFLVVAIFWFTRKPKSSSGKFCGGIAAIQCPKNYHCKITATYPDAGGICIPNYPYTY